MASLASRGKSVPWAIATAAHAQEGPGTPAPWASAPQTTPSLSLVRPPPPSSSLAPPTPRKSKGWGKFANLGALRPPMRVSCAAALASPEEALVFGGCTSGDRSNELFAFNETTCQWRRVETSGATPAPRAEHTLTRCGDKVVLFGGRVSHNGKLMCSDDAFVLDLAAWAWTAVRGMSGPSARRRHAAAALAGGQLLVHGGIGPDAAYDREVLRDDARLLDVHALEWRPPPHGMAVGGPSARMGHGAAADPAGATLFVCGGSDSSRMRCASRIEQWRFEQSCHPTVVGRGSVSNTDLKRSLATLRAATGSTASLLAAQAAPLQASASTATLAAAPPELSGARSDDGLADMVVHKFSMETGRWTALHGRGGAPEPRFGHTLVAVPVGREGCSLLLAGGMTATGLSNEVWLFECASNVWSKPWDRPSPRDFAPRAFHTAWASDAKVFVFGGTCGGYMAGDEVDCFRPAVAAAAAVHEGRDEAADGPVAPQPPDGTGAAGARGSDGGGLLQRAKPTRLQAQLRACGPRVRKSKWPLPETEDGTALSLPARRGRARTASAAPRTASGADAVGSGGLQAPKAGMAAALADSARSRSAATLEPLRTSGGLRKVAPEPSEGAPAAPQAASFAMLRASASAKSLAQLQGHGGVSSPHSLRELWARGAGQPRVRTWRLPSPVAR